MFVQTFEDLKKNGKVARHALEIPQFVQSVYFKMQTAYVGLYAVLKIDDYDKYEPGYSESYSGSASIPGLGSPRDVEIVGNLCAFFTNLYSAFDVFAHVVDLVYISPPISKTKVDFDKVVKEMTNRARLSEEEITKHIVSIQESQWFKDLKPYRDCDTHIKSVLPKVRIEYQPMQILAPSKVTTFIIPDSPHVKDPKYSKNREVNVFCKSIIGEATSSIQYAFDIMEIRIRDSGRIPVNLGG